MITEDNLVINIDTVIYFQVTDAKAATYEIADYIAAIEQLVVTTLRNVIGGMTLEDTLTSRDKISAALTLSRDVSVSSSVMPPITFLSVVTVSCSMAAMKSAIS